MSKRYVLLAASGGLSEHELKELTSVLDRRMGKAKVIKVRGRPELVIVKTSNDLTHLLRDPAPPLVVGGKRLTSVLTSGSIGKLKRVRRGSVESYNGQVHE